MATIYAEDILNKEKPKGEPFTFSSVASGTTTGAIIGLVGGVLYAWFKKKKYVDCMLIGTIGGGIVSRIFLIKK